MVEDDPDVRELVIRLLTDLGFATVEAEDGATGATVPTSRLFSHRAIPTGKFRLAWEGERLRIVSKPYTRGELAEALSNAL